MHDILYDSSVNFDDSNCPTVARLSQCHLNVWSSLYNAFISFKTFGIILCIMFVSSDMSLLQKFEVIEQFHTIGTLEL